VGSCSGGLQAGLQDAISIISGGNDLAIGYRERRSHSTEQKEALAWGARSGIAPDHAHGTLSGFRKLPARLVRGCFLQLDKVTFKQCIQLRACHVQLVWRILYKQ
jgi:hypothetical protein